MPFEHPTHKVQKHSLVLPVDFADGVIEAEIVRDGSLGLDVACIARVSRQSRQTDRKDSDLRRSKTTYLEHRRTLMSSFPAQGGLAEGLLVMQ